MRIRHCLFLLLLAVPAFAQDAPAPARESGVLAPFARIEAEALNECSGLQWHDGAWWGHNDSGDGPYLFRSATPDFRDAQRLAVPGAQAVDWEEITVFGGNLLVCDVGDNGRRRDDLMLYAVRYVPAEDGAKLETVAGYPMAWPDGRHDCEAAAVINGKLHLVIKQRGEGFTGIYRFDELKAGEKNVPALIGKLDVGPQTMITAADYDAASGKLILLSYTRVFVYAADRLEGPPEFSTRIEANQCEAICMHEGTLYVANEQRDVYRLPEYLKRRPESLLPPRVSLPLPISATAHKPDGTGEAWREAGAELPLRGALEGDTLRWTIAGGNLMLAGRFAYDGAFSSTSERGNRLGSGMFFGIGTGNSDDLEGTHRLFFIGDDAERGVDLWRMEVSPTLNLTPAIGVTRAGKTADGVFSFEFAIPLTALFPEGKLPQAALANAWGAGLKGQPHLAGLSWFSMLRPYTWADVTLKQPE